MRGDVFTSVKTNYKMIDLLKKLCELNGVSGHEDEVRDFIIGEIKDYVDDYKIDPLGSIIAFKKGENTPKHKLVVSAHMDEIGMIVTYINSDGTLKFDAVGGVDPRVVFGRQVEIGENRLAGVIGSKAVHNLTDDEKDTAPTFKNMYIDIGGNDKEDSQKFVNLGDRVVLKSDFIKFGENYIKSKAIDDRAGCAIMIELIKSNLKYDTTFTFVVQEEVGLRGATAAAYSVNPDFAIVLEATTAADIPSAKNEEQVCKCGSGPVISFMDKSTIYDKELYNLGFKTAMELNINCQTKTMVAGGNDSGAIHVSRGGVRTISISVPCRYLHSASCVIKSEDFVDSYKLAKKMIDNIQEKI